MPLFSWQRQYLSLSLSPFSTRLRFASFPLVRAPPSSFSREATAQSLLKPGAVCTHTGVLCASLSLSYCKRFLLLVRGCTSSLPELVRLSDSQKHTGAKSPHTHVTRSLLFHSLSLISASFSSASCFNPHFYASEQWPMTRSILRISPPPLRANEKLVVHVLLLVKFIVNLLFFIRFFKIEAVVVN